MDGGAAVASVGTDLTNGGKAGARGGWSSQWRRPAMLTAIVYSGFGLVYMVVNATSLIDDRQKLGQPIEPWRPWVWEATSLLAWLVILPVILWLATRAPPLSRPVRMVAFHLLATIPVSLGHSAGMFGFRAIAHVYAGEIYQISGPLAEVLLYEYRKDIITYASIVLAFFLIQRLAETVPAASPVRTAKLIEVRDGSSTVWLRPDEIDWIAAAGNYVELVGSFGTKLARRTLGEMEADLSSYGFVRVHRSRLVNKAAIAKVQTRQSGDFDIKLRSGEVVAGSRRFRRNL